MANGWLQSTMPCTSHQHSPSRNAREVASPSWQPGSVAERITQRIKRIDVPEPEKQPSSRNIYAFASPRAMTLPARWPTGCCLRSCRQSVCAQLGIVEGIAEALRPSCSFFPDTLPILLRAQTARRRRVLCRQPGSLLALVTSWWQVLAIRFADRFCKGIRRAPRDVMVAGWAAESRFRPTGSFRPWICSVRRRSRSGCFRFMAFAEFFGLPESRDFFASPSHCLGFGKFEKAGRSQRPRMGQNSRAVNLFACLPLSFTRVRGNAFLSRQLQRHVSQCCARRASAFPPPTAPGTGVQHHRPPVSWPDDQRPLLAPRNRRGRVSGIRWREAPPPSQPTLPPGQGRDGFVWPVLRPHQPSVKGAGCGDGRSRRAWPRSGRVCFRHQRGTLLASLAAGELWEVSTPREFRFIFLPESPGAECCWSRTARPKMALRG